MDSFLGMLLMRSMFIAVGGLIAMESCIAKSVGLFAGLVLFILVAIIYQFSIRVDGVATANSAIVWVLIFVVAGLSSKFGWAVFLAAVLAAYAALAASNFYGLQFFW